MKNLKNWKRFNESEFYSTSESTIDDLVEIIHDGDNILLVGQPGSGMDNIAKDALEQLNVKYEYIDAAQIETFDEIVEIVKETQRIGGFPIPRVIISRIDLIEKNWVARITELNGIISTTHDIEILPKSFINRNIVINI